MQLKYSEVSQQILIFVIKHNENFYNIHFEFNISSVQVQCFTQLHLGLSLLSHYWHGIWLDKRLQLQFTGQLYRDL